MEAQALAQIWFRTVWEAWVVGPHSTAWLNYELKRDRKSGTTGCQKEVKNFGLAPMRSTMMNLARRAPQARAEPVRIARSLLMASSIAAAVVGVSVTVLGINSGDERMILVAVASWVIFALAIRELITGRRRALMVITASVIAVGLVMPFQSPEIIPALSAVVILLAMAGHALRVEDGGDNRFLALATGIWVSQLLWTQPWGGPVLPVIAR
ncbi:hypothetical protein HQ535_09855 [bacterium]|nr:hypothetical protein [bacterium]